MQVTIIPNDNAIIIDGECLVFDFPKNKAIHAIQWDGISGHIEYKPTEKGEHVPNSEIKTEEFDSVIQPYVNLFTQEKQRINTEKQREIEEYNSKESRFKRLRMFRERRLAKTDYLMTSDYPLTEEQRQIVREYRTKLRDLPSQKGAPWDGGEENTPWPELKL